MTKKEDSASPIDSIELAQHIRNVLVNNSKTDTLVYGLLLSLNDDVERGVKRKTLKKEIMAACSIAHEQFHYLFFDDETSISNDET